MKSLSFECKTISWPSWKEKVLARDKKRYKKVLNHKVTIVSKTIKILHCDRNKNKNKIIEN